VALVLNLSTGHVSPQFHVKFDDLFEMMRPSSGNCPPPSLWQQKVGLLDAEKDPKSASQVTVQVKHCIATPSESWAGYHNDNPENPDNPPADDPSEEDESFEQGETIVLPGPEDDVIPPQNQEAPRMQQQQSRSGRTIRPTSWWLESLEQ
jgi:hypothetical protein